MRPQHQPDRAFSTLAGTPCRNDDDEARAERRTERDLDGRRREWSAWISAVTPKFPCDEPLADAQVHMVEPVVIGLALAGSAVATPRGAELEHVEAV